MSPSKRRIVIKGSDKSIDPFLSFNVPRPLVDNSEYDDSVEV
jgi:hypothetical protein